MNYKDNAMPLCKDRVNLTTGSFYDGVYLAVEDGTLSIVWEGTTTAVTVDCTSGQAFNVVGSKSVTIVSGMFHVA